MLGWKGFKHELRIKIRDSKSIGSLKLTENVFYKSLNGVNQRALDLWFACKTKYFRNYHKKDLVYEHKFAYL